MKFATELLLQDFANPFLINIEIEDGEIKMQLLHGNCFYGCVESAEQEEGVWKVFLQLFLSRLVPLQTQIDGWWVVLDVACGSCEAGRFPGAITLPSAASCQCWCSSELSNRTAPVLGAGQQFPFGPLYSDFLMLRDEA